MTLLHTRPQLFLRRLVVFAQGIIAYDQQFELGVNIIRGKNSSGKSTIADLIFFALGGDISKWKPEAERCTSVMAELQVNGAMLTVRRRLTSSPRQPMDIYWGPYSEASASSQTGWQSYPFQRSAHRESYSQVLFRCLGWPEVPSDAGSNITMHQALRLIYVDQLSSVQSLMRDEKFDSALIRTTVGDLLLGYYDDSLYADELELREKRKHFDSVTREVDSLALALARAGHEQDLGAIDKLIADSEDQLVRVHNALSSDSVEEKGSKSAGNPVALPNPNKLKNEAVRAKEALANLEFRIESVQFEIEDSKQFIASLEMRLSSIDESMQVTNMLRELPINKCPRCLCPILPPDDPNACILCKSPPLPEVQRSQLSRMKQELVLQIKESNALLVQKEETLLDLQREFPKVNSFARHTAREFQNASKNIQSPRNSRIDSLLIRKGFLESQIQFLHGQAKSMSVLEDLRIRKNSLALAIEHLAMSITSRKEKRAAIASVTSEKIQKYALHLLRQDLPREADFAIGQQISVDFPHNTFAIDGRNHFSASSITYLKNCIHFGIFFASVDMDTMRYPRLIICDNMEDKGMEEARSQNFQRTIVELSRKQEQPHQIIFTTSMIDPSLNTVPPCVGQQYNELNKTLKLS